MSQNSTGSPPLTLDEFEYQKSKKLYADMFMNKSNVQETPVEKKDDLKPRKIPNTLKMFMKDYDQRIAALRGQDLDAIKYRDLGGYRTSMCDQSETCQNQKCWYAHNKKELRKVGQPMSDKLVR